MIKVNCECQVCKTPMEVECDDSLPSNEIWIKFATCDNCMVRMGRMKISQANLPSLEPRSPHND